MLTDQQHPITPPPELVREWNEAAIGTRFPPYGYSEYIATKAARWGADQELDACVKWLRNDPVTHEIIGREARYLDLDLYGARRPKPPSLAEQATTELAEAVIRGDCITTSDAIPSLRAALKRLQELENNG